MQSGIPLEEDVHLSGSRGSFVIETQNTSPLLLPYSLDADLKPKAIDIICSLSFLNKSSISFRSVKKFALQVLIATILVLHCVFFSQFIFVPISVIELEIFAYMMRIFFSFF